MSKFRYKLKEEVNIDNISDKLSKMKPFQVDLDSLMDKDVLKEEEKDGKDGAWWSYLAEYLTGLSLAKKLAINNKILIKNEESVLEEIEKGLRGVLNKKINDSPNGKEWWSGQAEKRSKITAASRAMADKIISKLEGEKILDKYVLSMIIASGGGTGGDKEKADIKLSFTPIEDYEISPKDIGISIKTSLGDNKGLTVQPGIARISRFISLGDETGKDGGGHVDLGEFINSLKEAGLNKGPMVDLIKFLSLWSKVTSKKDEFAKEYQKLTGFTGSAYKTSIQDTLTSLINNESYDDYNSRRFKNKISESVYNKLKSKFGNELRKEYSELLSSYPKDTLSHAVAKAFVEGVNVKFSSASDDEWDKWKKYFLRWLGLGSGEWIIKSWYGKNENIPSVEDVLDPNTPSGKALKKLTEDFLNKDTKLEIIYLPESGKATFKFQIVNTITNEKYVAFEGHIIHSASTQFTMDLTKLIKNTSTESIPDGKKDLTSQIKDLKSQFKKLSDKMDKMSDEEFEATVDKNQEILDDLENQIKDLESKL
jgi:hypothetical protein